ncbi:unnamed protein product [Absidia cylindrospora]
MIFLGEIICIFGIQVVSKASSWLDCSLLNAAHVNGQQQFEMATNGQFNDLRGFGLVYGLLSQVHAILFQPQ